MPGIPAIDRSSCVAMVDTATTKKTGLRNPLEEAQVRRAVLALQAFVAKREAESDAKQPLLATAASISCILTRKLVPAKASLKPIPIDLPHALYEDGAEMCLIVKDEDKKRIKEALAADPVPALSKVMTVKKLRKNFSRFEDKRALAGAYDLFLADDRVLPYLKGPLGNKFFSKKKQPIAVRVSRKDVSFSVRAASRRTAMHVSAGVCTNVKVARMDMSPEEIVDNILVAMNNCAAHVAKGWSGVQSVSIKTDDSVALPVYNALAPLAKLPPTSKKVTLKKRKLEEFVAQGDEVAKEEKAPKAKKSEKKSEKKAKVEPSAQKEATPEAKKPRKSNKKAKSEASAKTEEPKEKVVKVTEKAAKKTAKKAEEPKEKVVKVTEKAAKKTAKKAEEPKEETPKKEKKSKKEEKSPKTVTPPAKKRSRKKVTAAK
ncbi:hypothetical protein BBJ28_00009269 [Nothophytophthora sp. Chile5]|nr:hypothetical protein BBJ28_00009269 [Nothophytophthora sp. Chile5]